MQNMDQRSANRSMIERAAHYESNRFSRRVTQSMITLIQEQLMESRAKLFGHAIHPMLITFPIGLLVTAIIFDIMHLVTGTALWASIAYYMIAAGIIGGLLAAVFGVIDYLGVPAGTRARSIGLAHGAGNVVMVALFAVSWLLRRPDPSAPSALALLVSFIGIALASVTAWLGGELVERLGVGVDDGAHLDAPSSLKGRAASAATTGNAS
jgi:uncharacterized membrane protein